MVRTLATAIVVLTLVAWTPATAVATDGGGGVTVPAPADAAPETTADRTPAETVVLRGAQVGQLRLANATVENVRIGVLRVDRATLQEEAGDELLNRTFGETGEQTVLRNVSIANLSVSNLSVGELRVAGSAGTNGTAAGTPTGQVPDVGAIDDVAIREMTVGEAVVETVAAGRQGRDGDLGDVGDVVGDIADEIGEFVDGGDGRDDGGETPDGGTEGADQAPDGGDGSLRVGVVAVDRMVIGRLAVDAVERRRPGAATPATGGRADTTLGRVAAGTARVDRLEAANVTHAAADDGGAPLSGTPGETLTGG